MPQTQSPKTSSPKEKKIPFGQSGVNPSDLHGLNQAWEAKRLVLFLGAGVSIPYGIPSWKDLVLELLFEQVQHKRRLKKMWPHYRRAVASWMTDYFGYSPLVLARMVERDAKKRAKKEEQSEDEIFIKQLRTQLYAQCKPPKGKRTTLQAIAELIKRSNGNVRCVVSFNFDGLLEEELAKRKVSTTSVFDGTRQFSGGFRIIHPHGFVPRQGTIERKHLVFTETDYHKLTESVFHWGLSEIVGELRHSTILFIGLSMSDPSLRRLLDATHNSDIPPHWQLQLQHQVRDHEQNEAIEDIAKRAREWGEILGHNNELKDSHELAAALNDILKQADSYDRDIFQGMGVKTIWLESYDDIPALLEMIPNPT